MALYVSIKFNNTHELWLAFQNHKFLFEFCCNSALIRPACDTTVFTYTITLPPPPPHLNDMIPVYRPLGTVDTRTF